MRLFLGEWRRWRVGRSGKTSVWIYSFTDESGHVGNELRRADAVLQAHLFVFLPASSHTRENN